MLRKVVAIGLALFFIVFGINRISQTKSVITSNYLVINSIESQNLEEIIKSVGFYTPSFSMDIDHMGTKPYTNTEEEVEVYIGDAIVGNTVNAGLEGSFTNNYLFSYIISYNNSTKKLDIQNKLPTNGSPETVTVIYDGDSMNLIQLR